MKIRIKTIEALQDIVLCCRADKLLYTFNPESLILRIKGRVKSTLTEDAINDNSILGDIKIES